MKATNTMDGSTHSGRFGPFAALKQFFFELRNGRVIVISLFTKNYLNRYADTAMGMLWIFVTPIVPIILYNFLQLAGLFGDPQGGIPRSVFLTYGLTLYYGFSESLVTSTGLIASNRGIIISSGTSKILIGLSELLGILFNFIVRSIVFWAITTSVGVDLGFRGFSIILWGFLMIGSGYAIGLILSLFTVIYKDITNFVSIIAFYLLFASGVFREIDNEGWIWDFLRSSPLYQIIGKTREYVFGQAVEITPFTIIAFLSVALFLISSLTIFYRGERYVDKIL